MSDATDLHALLQRARHRLRPLPREALGELQVRPRILGIPRAPRIVPVAEAWHVGILLLTDDDVRVTGRVVRARAEVRRGYTAESQRARADLAAAARRGGFAEGQSVHIDWLTLDLRELTERTSPLAVQAGVPMIRWSAAGGYTPLAGYLDERISLLQHPPAGA
jgi:hypothetical protein